MKSILKHEEQIKKIQFLRTKINYWEKLMGRTAELLYARKKIKSTPIEKEKKATNFPSIHLKACFQRFTTPIFQLKSHTEIPDAAFDISNQGRKSKRSRHNVPKKMDKT